MAVKQTLVKHDDLTVNQVTFIKKNVIAEVLNEDDFTPLMAEDAIPEGYDKLSWDKLIYTAPTTTDAYKLTEGVTPEPEDLGIARFEVSVDDYGKWIPYTDKSVKYGFHDVVNLANTKLANDARRITSIVKGSIFYQGVNTVTAETTLEDTFLKAGVILYKNEAEPFIGSEYLAIVTPEVAKDILKTYKDDITHTSEKEAIIKGEIGSIWGFRIIKRKYPFCYSSGKSYIVFMGKSGTLKTSPVSTVKLGEANVEVYNNPLGSIPQANMGTADSTDVVVSVYPDATHQRGSVAFKIQGLGACIKDDSALLRCEWTTAQITQSVGMADSARKHYTTESKSPKA